MRFAPTFAIVLAVLLSLTWGASAQTPQCANGQCSLPRSQPPAPAQTVATYYSRSTVVQSCQTATVTAPAFASGPFRRGGFHPVKNLGRALFGGCR